MGIEVRVESRLGGRLTRDIAVQGKRDGVRIVDFPDPVGPSKRKRPLSVSLSKSICCGWTKGPMASSRSECRRIYPALLRRSSSSTTLRTRSSTLILRLRTGDVLDDNLEVISTGSVTFLSPSRSASPSMRQSGAKSSAIVRPHLAQPFHR